MLIEVNCLCSTNKNKDTSIPKSVRLACRIILSVLTSESLTGRNHIQVLLGPLGLRRSELAILFGVIKLRRHSQMMGMSCGQNRLCDTILLKAID